ncbi:MAG TPA: AgmX/PglI C-terminal domain-containing protein [Polyangiales bacterium]|jgi:hypothetical protein|nr:AgmX/PglI C-terminal domain-containing protein [Polyangiales bacterium]
MSAPTPIPTEKPKLLALLAEDLEATQPKPDYARMEAMLQREAHDVVARERRARVLWPALAAAAVVLLGLAFALRAPSGQPREDRHASATTTRANPVQPVIDDPALQAVITALRGHGTVLAPNGSTRPLGIDSVLTEGETLLLADGSEAHVRVAQATGFAAEAGTRVTFARLRAHTLQLELASGAVTSQVRPLNPSERYEVRALGYTVAVRGTHFRVALRGSASQLTAAVSEGHVVVTNAAGEVVSDLRAPASFEVGRGRSDSAAVPLVPRVGLPDRAKWPSLVLPAWNDALAFTIDGTRLPAGAELAMRVPAGDVTLRAELAGGRQRELVLQVPEGGLHVESSVLQRLTRTDSDRPSADLDPADIRSVITSGLPALQRCYELSLKQRPDIGGRFTLRISVDPSGQARRVTPQGDEGAVPEALLQCIRSAALRWHFPAPGGSGATFDAPIRLTHAQ